MTDVISVAEGGFGYLQSENTPFSSAVVALDGFAFTRVRFRTPQPLAEGLRFAAAYLAEQGRPAASFAACEIRSPAALSMADFGKFNGQYVELLRSNGFGAQDAFPIARSNMAPSIDPPKSNTLFAFTFATPVISSSGATDFVISGKPENTSMEPSGVVASGDTSPAGMTAKAQHVIDELKLRVTELGARWSDITGSQIYTVESLDPVLKLLGASGLAAHGLSLFPGRPPVLGLDFEMDVRSISLERAS
jgi:hypothetical protein